MLARTRPSTVQILPVPVDDKPMAARTVSAFVFGSAILVFGALSLPSHPVQAGQTPEQSIASIEQKLAAALVNIEHIASDCTVEVAEAENEAAAAATRDGCLADLATRLDEARTDITGKYEQNPDDPGVQSAYAAALAELEAAEASAQAAMADAYAAWLESNGSPTTTTTTVAPTTTTSVAPTTTTSVAPTTTTSVAPTTTTSVAPTTTTTTTTIANTTTTTTVANGNKPPKPDKQSESSTSSTTLANGNKPPKPDKQSESSTSSTTTLVAAVPPVKPVPPRDARLSFMPELQDLAVSSKVATTEGADSEIATVGFVRRVVDSQLPAGVADVAAGPLVVLGLIIDAIRAAGALMVVPWMVLGIYMFTLVRGRPRLSPVAK